MRSPAIAAWLFKQLKEGCKTEGLAGPDGFREPKNLEPRLWFQVFDPRGLFHLDRKQRRTTMLRSSFRIVNFS